MPEVTIVYWRDIPAQVIVGKGRRGSKVQLHERFEQAIDRAAMKCNLKGSDDYLAEWWKSEPYTVEGDPDTVARNEARRIETEFNQEILKTLIKNEARNNLVSGVNMALLKFKKSQKQIVSTKDFNELLNGFSMEIMPRTAEKLIILLIFYLPIL